MLAYLRRNDKRISQCVGSVTTTCGACNFDAAIPSALVGSSVAVWNVLLAADIAISSVSVAASIAISSVCRGPGRSNTKCVCGYRPSVCVATDMAV